MDPNFATGTRFCELFELDHETGVLTRKISRRGPIRAGDVAGSLDRHGYLRVFIDGRSTSVHRVIFAMANGYLPEYVDHLDGNRLNNRPANLRAATKSENAWNAKRPSNNKSGFKGVTWHKGAGKWMAYCGAGQRKRHLGLFEDLNAAAEAAKASREAMHGKFARHE